MHIAITLLSSFPVKGSWLAYSGRFTHINGYPSAAGSLQAREAQYLVINWI